MVADHTWAAMRGRAALDVTWDHGANASYDSDRYREVLSKAVSVPGTVARKVGDTESALKSAARVVEAEYHVPHLPHMPMEPVVAVARVDGNRCEVWAPTQNPQAAQTEVARALGHARGQGPGPRDISWRRVWTEVESGLLLGGGAAVAAARRACSGAVHARRRRAPRLRKHRQHQPPHRGTGRERTRRRVAPPNCVPVDWKSLRPRPLEPGLDDLQQGVLDLALAVPNVTAEICDATAHTRIGWLRSVYNIFQGFSIGSFVDELAHAKGADPRDVWLEMIGPPRTMSLSDLGIEKLPNYGQPLDKHPVDAGRLRNVIERVTRAANWSERGKGGRALGLAAHRSFLSYTAVVAFGCEAIRTGRSRWTRCGWRSTPARSSTPIACAPRWKGR